MAPTGGTSRLIGNNPLAYSFPTRQGFTFALDMATSVVAGFRLLMAIERGENIPTGWAVDGHGQPTDDPRAWRERDGLLLPIGGAKGHGLAVVLDVLCGVLSGGHFGAQRNEPGSTDTSQFFLAMRIDRFMPLEQFLDRMDAMIEQIRASELAPGSTGVFLPGEMEHHQKQDRLVNGVPLDAKTVEGAGADQAGVRARIPVCGASMKIENAHYVFEVSPDNGALVRLRDKLGGIELLTHGRLAESFRLLLPLPEACRPTTFSGPSSNCRRRT